MNWILLTGINMANVLCPPIQNFIPFNPILLYRSVCYILKCVQLPKFNDGTLHPILNIASYPGAVFSHLTTDPNLDGSVISFLHKSNFENFNEWVVGVQRLHSLKSK